MIERVRQLTENDTNLSDEGSSTTRGDLRQLIRSALARVQVHADRIDVTLSRGRLNEWFCSNNDQDSPLVAPSPGSETSLVTLNISARLKRAGKEMKIIASDGSDPTTPDTSLVHLLVRALSVVS